MVLQSATGYLTLELPINNTLVRCLGLGGSRALVVLGPNCKHAVEFEILSQAVS